MSSNKNVLFSCFWPPAFTNTARRQRELRMTYRAEVDSAAAGAAWASSRRFPARAIIIGSSHGQLISATAMLRPTVEDDGIYDIDARRARAPQDDAALSHISSTTRKATLFLTPSFSLLLHLRLLDARPKKRLHFQAEWHVPLHYHSYFTGF